MANTLPRKQKGVSPAPPQSVARSQQPARQPKRKSYASEGVTDNDIFLLPVSDYQIMALLTLVGTVVRLFRIYQPTSVVFDEVQYVSMLYLLVIR